MSPHCPSLVWWGTLTANVTFLALNFLNFCRIIRLRDQVAAELQMLRDANVTAQFTLERLAAAKRGDEIKAANDAL